MDWNQVLWAALGGGLGGGLGALASSLVTNKSLKGVLVILPMLMVGQFVPRLMAQHPLLPTSKVERAARLSEEALRRSPAFAQLLQGKSAAEASALIQQKSHAGLKRLSPEDLLLWNRLRLAMAERSPVLCAGFWTGRGVSGQLIADTLNRMEQSDVDGFIGVSTRATVAEVETKPFEPPQPTTFAAALPKIKEGLPVADAERLDQVLAHGMSAAPEDGCWAVKVLMRDSSRLGAPDKERFLRFMASL
jgi:hypothetical protein